MDPILIRHRFWFATAIAVLISACSPEPHVPEQETPVAELLGQGEAMVENMCAACHAIGATDESSHADAPPLRDLSKRLDLNELRQPMLDGIVVDHPDMPEFAFEPHHVDALLYYLQSIQTD